MHNPHTILVVQIGKIGDMILTTPLFSGLKKIFPHSKLTVLASSVNQDIPLHHPDVDQVVTFKKNFLGNLLLLYSSLKNVDLWIDTKDDYSKTSEILLKIFKPKKSIGFNYDKNIFDINLKDFKMGNHAVDIGLSPINYLTESKERMTILPHFEIPKNIEKKFEDVLDANPYVTKVLINISAGNESRCLPNDKWIDIINRIHLTNFYCFYLIGLEKDMEKIDYILKETTSLTVKYFGTKNIIETSEIIRRSDIVISPDTSIVHICSVLNKPVIALYPDVKWNLEKFYPLSDHKEIIISHSKESIEDIKVNTVVAAFKKLTETINSGNAESRTRVRKEDH